MRLKLLVLLLLVANTLYAADIIPQPRFVVEGNGEYLLGAKATLVCDKELGDAADYLLSYLPLRKVSSKRADVRLVLDDKLKSEEYQLRIDTNGVEVRGGAYGGVFNGVQTLLQLMPSEVYGKKLKLPVKVGHIVVSDAPRYAYRGFLLDVARTYMPLHEVKRAIDYMALLKLNKLHFHLVDNTGWRIEIKSHPELAKVGGWRGGDSPIHPVYGSFFEKYGGYYTQEELREVVKYAAQRNVEVIPEIDVPGHSKGLGAVRPDILCGYVPDTTITNGIDTRNVWCASKESNYRLIEDIVKEVAEIFPSEYLHIGGDEVNFNWWRQCPDCQKLCKEKGITVGPQLEEYMLMRVSDILTRYNRKPMVWNEAIRGGKMAKSTTVCGWLGWRGCLDAMNGGYPTVVMPARIFYLDKRQGPNETGHTSKFGITLKTICDFTYELAGFTPEQQKHIVGVEGALWGEIILSNIDPKGRFSDYLEYMIFPRLFAVSEVAWCENRRSYEEMYATIKRSFYEKLNVMGATYRLNPPVVEVKEGKLTAKVDDGSKIYYTDIRTTERRAYTEPLDASLAPWVAFHSYAGTGRSGIAAAPEYWQYRTPKMTATSSMPFSEKRPLKLCEEYKQAAYTARCARKGDWVEFRFEEPLDCQYIEVITGFYQVFRRLIYNGHIELSYDGKTFENAGLLHNGKIELRPTRTIYALRIVADGITDAEEYTVIRPLKIK